MSSSKGLFHSSISCSICLEVVNDGSDRSIAKLTCGHHFHLDCIGSAFNAKGLMQCPNCRHTENGQWLYANGCRPRDESMMEDMMNDEDYDVLARVSELLFPHDLMLGHMQWCPFQSSYTQLLLSLGDIEHSSSAHADVVVNVLFGDHTGSLDPPLACPFFQTQGASFDRHHHALEENMGVQGFPWNSHREVLGQSLPSSRGPWAQRPPTSSNLSSGSGASGSGMTFLDSRRRRPQYDGRQSVGDSFSSRFSENGMRRPSLPAVQPSGRQHGHYPEGHMLPPSLNQEYSGAPHTQGGARPRDRVAFPQWRQDGASSFQHYSRERESEGGGQWAPPPLSGLYGLHAAHGSETAQVGPRAPEIQPPNQYHGHYQPFPFPFMLESQVDMGSFQPPTSSFDPSR